MKKNIIIFDFDGTIVDSTDLTLEILKKQNPSISRQDWLEVNTGKNKDKNKLKVSSKLFYLEYDKRIDKIHPIEKIKETIEQLKPNYDLAIVSGSPFTSISGYLKKYDFKAQFSTIRGSNKSNNKLIVLRDVLRKKQAKPGKVVWVTDTVGDVLKAETLGIKVIAVTWGLFKKTDFKDFGCPIVDQAEDLITAIKSTFKEK